MTKRKLYLALQAVVCSALAVWLSVSAAAIYREGSARKAEQPLASVYTPEAAAGAFAPIAPLFFTGVGLLIAGLVLGVKDEGIERPDAETQRDLLVSRVAQPSPAMLSERRRQRRLLWAGRAVFALCMLRLLAFLLNPEHFPEADPEGMFQALLRVFLPWTAAGLCALALTSALREKSLSREAQAARRRLAEEKAAGAGPAAMPAWRAKKTAVPQMLLLAAAVALIIAGVLNGSALDVLSKAITICTECVGLG